MDANEFLNSKGLIYTRELININDERINLIELLNEYKALSQHDVSGMLKSFVTYAKSRSISDININDDTIDYFIEDFNCH